MNFRQTHSNSPAHQPDGLKSRQGLSIRTVRERRRVWRADSAGRNRSFSRSFCEESYRSNLGRRHPPIVVGVALELALDTANDDVAFAAMALARRKRAVGAGDQRDAATWLGDAIQACAQAGWLLACADRFAASLSRNRGSPNSSGAGTCGGRRAKRIRLLAALRSAEAKSTRETEVSE
jgi:hypothetical protein